MDSVTVALRAIRIEHWTESLVLLSVLLVAWVALRLTKRIGARGRAWRRVTVWITGLTTVLLYASIALLFAVCRGGESGVPGKRRLAVALGTPIVDALLRYHRATGAYPSHLADLVPSYLSSDQLRAPVESPLAHAFTYSLDSAGYRLEIEYTGPGMNYCRHAPASDWICSGYF